MKVMCSDEEQLTNQIESVATGLEADEADEEGAAGWNRHKRWPKRHWRTCGTSKTLYNVNDDVDDAAAAVAPLRSVSTLHLSVQQKPKPHLLHYYYYYSHRLNWHQFNFNSINSLD